MCHCKHKNLKTLLINIIYTIDIVSVSAGFFLIIIIITIIITNIIITIIVTIIIIITIIIT